MILLSLHNFRLSLFNQFSISLSLSTPFFHFISLCNPVLHSLFLFCSFILPCLSSIFFYFLSLFPPICNPFNHSPLSLSNLFYLPLPFILLSLCLSISDPVFHSLSNPFFHFPLSVIHSLIFPLSPIHSLIFPLSLIHFFHSPESILSFSLSLSLDLIVIGNETCESSLPYYCEQHRH